MEGMVFDIQRLSVHDGPGIRTTVFLKGCPLRCVWCHNPESNAIQPQLAFHENLCIGCGNCFAICPNQCHALNNGRHEIARAQCAGCGLCVQACTGALEILGKRCTVEEVMKEVRKDASFYRTSGGGVTVSGGEPLMQPDFTYELLSAAKKEGLHTCLETSGYGPLQTILKFSSAVDLFLYDVKETDSKRHLKFTGVENQQILENLFAIDELGASSILRCPIIPGFNDRDGHFNSIAKLANQLRHVCMIHVEPYNSFGEGKAQSIGSQYALKGVQPPEEERVAEWVNLIQAKAHVPVVKNG